MVKKIENGSKVKLHYTGTLEGGEVFDTSDGKDPLEFEIGAKAVIPGFETGVIGLSKGEEKEITIKPEDAYGPRNEELKQKVPKDQLPENLKDAKKGMYLKMQAPNGQSFNALISDETEKELVLDMNHPLAGKNLKFKVKIVSVE